MRIGEGEDQIKTELERSKKSCQKEGPKPYSHLHARASSKRSFPSGGPGGKKSFLILEEEGLREGGAV